MRIKYSILLFIVIGVLSCNEDDDTGPGLACIPASLQKNVIAFYPFNQGSLFDVSANKGVLVNSGGARPTQDRNQQSDCAFVFNNPDGQQTNEFLSTTTSNFLNGLSDFSISTWYMPQDATKDTGRYQILVSRAEERRCPDRRGEWSLGLYDARQAVFGHNNSVWSRKASLIETWYHVVAVKSGDQYKIYLDGDQRSSATGNAQCSAIHLAQDIGDVIVGKYYSGKIDDLIIFDKALSQNEVSELFEMETCCN